MPCANYLGFEVEIDNERNRVTLTQTRQIDKILEHSKMESCNPESTPEAESNSHEDEQALLPSEYPFKELVGSLLYLARMTRPDIFHAVSTASKTNKPRIEHWNRLKRILRYLKGTRNAGLSYLKSDKCDLTGFSDSDYANDIETRRSTSGYVVMISGSPISWSLHYRPPRPSTWRPVNWRKILYRSKDYLSNWA